jgi:hypothetical protein
MSGRSHLRADARAAVGLRGGRKDEMSETFQPKTGGCLCGAIRYRLVDDPATLYACHCTDCQTATGSSFVLSMIVPREAIELVRGAPEVSEFVLDGGRRVRRLFCRACGTALWSEPPAVPQVRTLRAGTLDDTSWFEPVGHIWTRSAQRWVRIPPDTLNYEQQPPDMLPLVRAWKARSANPAA